MVYRGFVVGKNTIKKQLRRLSALKTWQLLILLFLVLFIATTTLRINNVGMVQRRAAVLEADKNLDEEAAARHLIALKDYVNSHMNTDPGKITLEHILERDNEKAIRETERRTRGNPNGNIFKKAEEVCRPRFKYGYSVAYQQCIIDEQNKYPTNEKLDDKVTLPIVEKYEYTFSTPTWSPDIAGWTVIVAILLSLLIVIKIIFISILKLLLSRYRPKI